MSNKFNVEPPKANDKVNTPFQELKAQLQGRSLFIMMPLYGGMVNGTTAKCVSETLLLGQKLGIDVRISYIFNESLINRARNYLMQNFLDSDCTHCMSIDGDIAFSPQSVYELLVLQGKKNTDGIEMDIVGALYPKKVISADKVVAAVKAGLCDENPEDIFKYAADFVVNPMVNSTSIDLAKPIHVQDIGTGFMLTSREVINKIRRNSSHLKYKPDHIRSAGFDGTRPIYNLFEVTIDEESNRLLSEDYGFLRLAKRSGCNCFAMPWMELGHIGTFMFKGSLLNIAKLANVIKDEYKISLSGPLQKRNENENK